MGCGADGIALQVAQENRKRKDNEGLESEYYWDDRHQSCAELARESDTIYNASNMPIAKGRRIEN